MSNDAQAVEQREEKAEHAAEPGMRWECRKHNKTLYGDSPSCVDPKLYCRYRTSCLVYNRALLDD